MRLALHTVISNGCPVRLSEHSEYYGGRWQLPGVGITKLEKSRVGRENLANVHLYWASWKHKSGEKYIMDYRLKDLLPVG